MPNTTQIEIPQGRRRAGSGRIWRYPRLAVLSAVVWVPGAFAGRINVTLDAVLDQNFTDRPGFFGGGTVHAGRRWGYRLWRLRPVWRELHAPPALTAYSTETSTQPGSVAGRFLRNTIRRVLGKGSPLWMARW